MKPTLLLLACLIMPSMAQAQPIPLGLECSLATTVHSNVFPKSEISAEDQALLNHCMSAVQTYARAHCPQSKRTLWQQIEAVAYSGPGIPDKKALLAACN